MLTRVGMERASCIFLYFLWVSVFNKLISEPLNFCCFKYCPLLFSLPLSLSGHSTIHGYTVFIGYGVLTFSVVFLSSVFCELQLSHLRFLAVPSLPRSLCSVCFMVASQGLLSLPFPFPPSWNFELSKFDNTHYSSMVSIFY